jgi:steroid 5-alpha reductase family enzyme
MSTLSLFGLGALFVVLSMSVIFVIGRRAVNYSYVDIGWSGNFALLAILYGLCGEGLLERRWLIGLMYGLWSVRLAWHLGRRVLGHPEEGRYVELRRKWGVNGEAAFHRRMYRFYLIQAALNVILAWPMLLAVNDTTPMLSTLELTGAALWVVALIGESIADAQLNAFKASPANHGKVCDRGLWSWSRHPNYFFEWLIWVSYALVALSVANVGWTGLFMPALMLYFLMKVTGIPATEAQALRSKGDAYADYQARTSVFIPLPPRRKQP